MHIEVLSVVSLLEMVWVEFPLRRIVNDALDSSSQVENIRWLFPTDMGQTSMNIATLTILEWWKINNVWFLEARGGC